MLGLELTSNQRDEVSSLPIRPCPQAVYRVSLLPSSRSEQADAWGRFAGTGAETTSQLDAAEWRLIALRAGRGHSNFPARRASRANRPENRAAGRSL